MLEVKAKADLEKMLQVGKVDVGNGTLFGTAMKRPPQNQRLTLVISSGGSGMSSIKEAIRMADQKLEMGYRNYVKFIVVDSSTGELSAVERSGIRTLNISSPGAQSRMEHSVRPAFFKKFMPRDYNILLINEHGASQDRMTGKIKLYDSQEGTTNDNRFRQMIMNLFTGEWSSYVNLPVDLMILSGISGGNGSGTFMDLAARAKKACLDAGARSVTVYGYLMLPDTAERFANSDDAKKSLYRNGFAALKELESYMSLGFNQERKETISSTTEANDIVLSATNLLFDYPVLISGNYDDSVSMIAETIVNLIADSDGAFDQNAFYSNIGTARATALSLGQMCDNGILKKGACPEDSHMYCGIGYAHASIPEKIVIPNIVSKICNKLYVYDDSMGLGQEETKTAFCSNSKHLGRHDFEQQIRLLFSFDKNQPLQVNSLWLKVRAILEQKGRLEENEAEISFQDIVSGDIKEYTDGFHAERRRQDGEEAFLGELKKLYDGFVVSAKTVMKQYGPRAIEYLYYGEGDADAAGVKEDFTAISIRTLLDTVESEFLKLSGQTGRHPDLLSQKGLIGRAMEAMMKTKVNEWKGAKRKAVQFDVYSGIAGAMTGAGGGWKKEYSDKVEHFVSCCMRFADVLETLTDYYAGEGKSLDAASYEDFSKTTGERNGINLCSDEKMYHWVKQQVIEKVNGIRIQDVKNDLIDDFMEHSYDWISTEPGVARRQYDEIMSKCCAIGQYAAANNGLNLTITDYFDELLDGVPETQQQTQIDNVVRQIMARLNTSSRPSLRVEPNSFYVTNKMILVPQSLIVGAYGPMIKQSFEANLGVAGDAMGAVAVSSVVDAIVCYQTSVAHALSSIRDLPLWEQGYESVPLNTMHLCNGEHETQYTELTKTEKDRRRNINEGPVSPQEDILFGTGLSWLHYPSINLKAYENRFSEAGSTTEAKYRREVFDKKVEYALREGILECEKTGNAYQYFVNLLPEDWTNLSLAGYRQKESGRIRRGKLLFEYLANQNTHSSAVWRKPLFLNGSQFFSHPFDFEQIIEVEHWSEARIRQEHLAYAKRILRKDTYLYQQMESTLYRYYGLGKLLEEKDKSFAEEYNAQVFAELYLYGMINSEEDDYEWNLRIDLRAGIMNIMNFGRSTRAKLSGLEKGLYGDGLIFPLVFRKFCQMDLQYQKYVDLKNDYVDSLKDKELDELVDGRICILKESCGKFDDLFGSAKDPVDELMVKYQLEDDQVKEAEQICKFYEIAKEVIKNEQ